MLDDVFVLLCTCAAVVKCAVVKWCSGGELDLFARVLQVPRGARVVRSSKCCCMLCAGASCAACICAPCTSVPASQITCQLFGTDKIMNAEGRSPDYIQLR